MATAKNQKLNRDGAQAKKNYTSTRRGTDGGGYGTNHIHKKADVTAGVILDTPDGRHQLYLDIDGKRKGWTTSTSPGCFQVMCGEDRTEADNSMMLEAWNGDISIIAHNGKIRMQGTDIEMVAIGGADEGKGNITCTASETFTVHDTPKILLQSSSLTKITSGGIMWIASNSCMKIYSSIIRGVTDAVTNKDSKVGGQRFAKENNNL